MPRFVLLYHDCPADYVRRSHWDLMLESGDMLRTWALQLDCRVSWNVRTDEQRKSMLNARHCADGNEVAAEQLADHRLRYLEYEGEVSGQRGRVIRVASGSCSSERDAPDCQSIHSKATRFLAG